MLGHQIIPHPSSPEWCVFIHGAGGSSNVWYKQIRYFQQHFNLLLIDLRGHGKSSSMICSLHQSQPYCFKEITNDVLVVLDKLQIERCHFIGLSLGTIIIRELAELEPHRVKSMVMGGAIVKFNIRSRLLLWLANQIKHLLPYMWIYKLYAQILMPQKKHRESRILFIKEAIKIKRNEFLKWMALNTEVNSLLNSFWQKELPLPTIYIMGDNDYIFLSQVLLLVNNHKQYSSLHIIPHAGHICNVDQSEIFNRISVSFIYQQINHPKITGQTY